MGDLPAQYRRTEGWHSLNRVTVEGNGRGREAGSNGHFTPDIQADARRGPRYPWPMNEFRIDDIARRLFESVPPALRSVGQDLEANFRVVLRSSLAKLDLVTRDEFDAQLKVLERARARLAALEERVKALEAQGPRPG
jgi:ubiquinone biosynthesis accessory factor UbiK